MNNKVDLSTAFLISEFLLSLTIHSAPLAEPKDKPGFLYTLINSPASPDQQPRKMRQPTTKEA